MESEEEAARQRSLSRVAASHESAEMGTCEEEEEGGQDSSTGRLAVEDTPSCTHSLVLRSYMQTWSRLAVCDPAMAAGVAGM